MAVLIPHHPFRFTATQRVELVRMERSSRPGEPYCTLEMYTAACAQPGWWSAAAAGGTTAHSGGRHGDDDSHVTDGGRNGH
ncbi:hypothetical protein ABZ467_39470 [Streptomyces sp. NPDC005727]|uniref:hypothetical protein n=1 Tax=Streptomyces sp. NPDC005727 TaxID=3157053 RepID=UPI0033EACB76